MERRKKFSFKGKILKEISILKKNKKKVKADTLTKTSQNICA